MCTKLSRLLAGNTCLCYFYKAEHRFLALLQQSFTPTYVSPPVSSSGQLYWHRTASYMQRSLGCSASVG